MKLFWVLALAMLRPLYFIYSIACLAAPFFILYCAAYYFYPQLTSPNVVGVQPIAGRIFNQVA